jgi:hypothetical protein
MDAATTNPPDVLSYASVYPCPPTTGLANEDLLVSRPGDDPWDRAIDDLLALYYLEDDWDGEGSVAPARPLIDSALSLAQRLRSGAIARSGFPGIGLSAARPAQQLPSGADPAPSRVAAGPEGTILLEWQEQQPGGADVIYFEIEICAPDRAEWMLAIPGQPTQHGEVSGWVPGC